MATGTREEGLVGTSALSGLQVIRRSSYHLCTAGRCSYKVPALQPDECLR